MKVSYKKLWKLLIDKDMKKRDLERCAGKCYNRYSWEDLQGIRVYNERYYGIY